MLNPVSSPAPLLFLLLLVTVLLANIRITRTEEQSINSNASLDHNPTDAEGSPFSNLSLLIDGTISSLPIDPTTVNSSSDSSIRTTTTTTTPERIRLLDEEMEITRRLINQYTHRLKQLEELRNYYSDECNSSHDPKDRDISTVATIHNENVNNLPMNKQAEEHTQTTVSRGTESRQSSPSLPHHNSSSVSFRLFRYSHSTDATIEYASVSTDTSISDGMTPDSPYTTLFGNRIDRTKPRILKGHFFLSISRSNFLSMLPRRSPPNNAHNKNDNGKDTQRSIVNSSIYMQPQPILVQIYSNGIIYFIMHGIRIPVRSDFPSLSSSVPDIVSTIYIPVPIPATLYDSSIVTQDEASSLLIVSTSTNEIYFFQVYICASNTSIVGIFNCADENYIPKTLFDNDTFNHHPLHLRAILKIRKRISLDENDGFSRSLHFVTPVDSHVAPNRIQIVVGTTNGKILTYTLNGTRSHEYDAVSSSPVHTITSYGTLVTYAQSSSIHFLLLVPSRLQYGTCSANIDNVYEENSEYAVTSLAFGGKSSSGLWAALRNGDIVFFHIKPTRVGDRQSHLPNAAGSITAVQYPTKRYPRITQRIMGKEQNWSTVSLPLLQLQGYNRYMIAALQGGGIAIFTANYTGGSLQTMESCELCNYNYVSNDDNYLPLHMAVSVNDLASLHNGILATYRQKYEHQHSPKESTYNFLSLVEYTHNRTEDTKVYECTLGSNDGEFEQWMESGEGWLRTPLILLIFLGIFYYHRQSVVNQRESVWSNRFTENDYEDTEYDNTLDGKPSLGSSIVSNIKKVLRYGIMGVIGMSHGIFGSVLRSKIQLSRRKKQQTFGSIFLQQDRDTTDSDDHDDVHNNEELHSWIKEHIQKLENNNDPKANELQKILQELQQEKMRDQRHGKSNITNFNRNSFVSSESLNPLTMEEEDLLQEIARKAALRTVTESRSVDPRTFSPFGNPTYGIRPTESSSGILNDDQVRPYENRSYRTIANRMRQYSQTASNVVEPVSSSEDEEDSLRNNVGKNLLPSSFRKLSSDFPENIQSVSTHGNNISIDRTYDTLLSDSRNNVDVYGTDSDDSM